MASLSSELSNWALVRRLFALSWRYRWGCIIVLILQTVIVSLGLWGLGLTGLGVDEMRGAVDPSAKAPRWPLHLAPPASWPPMKVIAAIALAVLVLGVLRGLLDYFYRVEMNRLVQAQIAVHFR